MTSAASAETVRQRPGQNGWYGQTPAEVAGTLHVDPAVGLTSHQAADLLEQYGPNALPAEAPVPAWKRFIGQYRTYMQVILFAAAVVSLRDQGVEPPAVLLILITVLNAAVGLRQEGKAESAMNALKSMMKATARVRRDG